jgi:hypothetical protein
VPGEKSLDVSFLKQGISTVAYTIVQNSQTVDEGTYEIENIIDK